MESGVLRQVLLRNAFEGLGLVVCWCRSAWQCAGFCGASQYVRCVRTVDSGLRLLMLYRFGDQQILLLQMEPSGCVVLDSRCAVV